MIISRSNKRATLYNNGIRNRILYREEELSSGDRLMIAKNNYFWTAGNKEMDFIANGEIIQVLRVRKTYELYGFRFADVSVRFQDYDLETDVKILLDTLQTAAPALPKDLNDKLFYTILEDYRLYHGRNAWRRLLPLALHRLYTCDPPALSGESAEGIRRICLVLI